MGAEVSHREKAAWGRHKQAEAGKAGAIKSRKEAVAAGSGRKVESC